MENQDAAKTRSSKSRGILGVYVFVEKTRRAVET